MGPEERRARAVWRGPALRARMFGALLLIGALLAGVGVAIAFALHQRLMGVGIRNYVGDMASDAAETIEGRLDEREKLLRLCASSDAARRYLEAPSYEGPVYENLLRNLRALVAVDGRISLAYIQAVPDHYFCCQSDAIPPDRNYTPVGRPWYDLAVARGGFIVTPPYLEQAGESLGQTGKPMFSAALPVHDAAGKLIGVAAVDLLLGSSQMLFSSIVSRKGGYVVVATADGTVLHGPHSPAEGGAIHRLENTRDYPVAAQAMGSHASALRLRDPASGRWVWAGTGTVRGVGWSVIAVFPEEALPAGFGIFTWDLIGIGAVQFAVFALLSVFLYLRISRMETALGGECDRYRGMFARLPDAALAADGEGRITEANRMFLALTGAEAGACIGRGIAELVHAEDTAKARELLGAAAREGGVTVELRFMKSDGTFAVCDAAATLLWGERPGVVIAVHDTAREKQQARRVEEVEAELQELNRIMIQREFRVNELRERVRELERGAGGGAGG